jgi:two-component system, cell cycle sensor histidine kinase and response regulator CckA
MKKQRGGSINDLRERAEERLKPKRDEYRARSAEPVTTEDAGEIIHELRVHQVELEMQNEELRNAQAQIEESCSRYSDLYDFAPIGYLTLNEKGLIREANLTAAKQLGIERGQLILKPFQVHVAAEDRESFRLYLGSVLKSRERQTCELKLIAHTGVAFYVRMDGISVRDPGGITLCNLTVTDISERKRMEEELLKARKLEATGILAGGIAHDFNNLLAVILGHINMAELELISIALIEPESGKRGLAALSNAERAVFLATNLTKRFITFSSGGKPRLVSTPVQELVLDACALALSGSNIVYQYSFGHDLEEVDGDPSQLRQALYDVIFNAREAMPAGGTLRILVENSKSGPSGGESGLPINSENRQVIISIRDEGVGIPEQNLPKIFDPYFSTKDRGSQKGMGLGLTTVHSIIKRHNGHVRVESKVGIGTTFDISLPVSEKRVAARRETGKPPVERKGKVLLLDDEETLRNMVGQMLNHLGHNVEFAGDGVEAIELFCRARDSGAPFDVVILDLTIRGGMGGNEAIQRLREIDPSVKAIVSSGHSNDPILGDFRGFGFSGVLHKPYRMRELAEILQEMMIE